MGRGSTVFLCHLAGVQHLFPKSFLSWWIICSLLLLLDRAGFLIVVTFGLCSSVLWGCWLLQLQVGVRCVKPRKPRECSTVPRVGSRGPWWVCLLSSFQSCLFYTACLGILVALKSRNREEYVHSIFPEIKVTMCIYFIVLLIISFF